MSKKSIHWLLKELPLLVDRGIITAESATHIRLFYTELNGNRKNSAMLILSIIGVALIGLGVILLLAHNWQELGRESRTAVALIPLITAQLLCLWSIRSHPRYNEACATILTLTLGSAIALITQTYNVPGDTESFLLIWLLLSLPLVYLMRVNLPALIYICGILYWSAYSVMGSIAYWPLTALILPHFMRVKKTNWSLGWTLCICTSIAIPISAGQLMAQYWPLLLSSFFATIYLIGCLQPAGEGLKPFKISGALGLSLIHI